MINVDNIILVMYSVAWLLLLRKVGRNGRYTLAYCMIALYFILSIIAIYTFNSTYAWLYYDSKITFFPLLYLFTMIFLAILPLIALREKHVRVIKIPSNNQLKILNWIFIISALYGIILKLPDIKSGFLVMLSDSDTITDLYEVSTELRKDSVNGSPGFKILGILTSQAVTFVPFLFFVNLLNTKKEKVTSMLLIISLLQAPLSGIAHASRLELIANIMMLFLLFTFFRPYLSTSIKKKIYKISLIFIGTIVSLFIVITVARVNTAGQTSTIFNLARYLGGSELVFDQFCLDANGTREGNFVAPLILKCMGQETLSENEIRDKYREMKVNNSRFSTFVGDFVLDFGPYSTVLIFIIFSWVFTRYLANKGILSFGQIIIVYLVIRFASGFYQYQYTSIAGNITFGLLILLAMFSNKLSLQVIKRRSE